MADVGNRTSQESYSSNDDYVNVENPSPENSSPEMINDEEAEEPQEGTAGGKLIDFEVSCLEKAILPVCTHSKPVGVHGSLRFAGHQKYSIFDLCRPKKLMNLFKFHQPE